MIQIVKAEECSGCSACVQVCPKKCIDFCEDKEGFFYPEVDKERCINCDLCRKVCPVLNSRDHHPVLKCYGAVSEDHQLRLQSSSGGVFGMLCRSTLEKDGIVYGVRMSDDCKEAVFDMICGSDDHRRLLGSKYVQSYPENIFADIKNQLSQGRNVLFSGTPCQVNGLRLFLGKDYDNLLLVDIICHGVPSPALWRKYVDELERKTGRSLKYVNFRCKLSGWEESGINELIRSGDAFFSHKDSDKYMGFFLNNISLRPSCYDCRSKTFRCSDITLGDFWSIDSVAPDFNDRQGTSAVIVRTPKGMEAFGNVMERMKVIDTSYEDVIRKNSSEYMSVKKNEKREAFFSDMENTDTKHLSKKYLEVSLYRKVGRKLKKVLKKAMFKTEKMNDRNANVSGDAMTYGTLFIFDKTSKKSK